MLLDQQTPIANEVAKVCEKTPENAQDAIYKLNILMRAGMTKEAIDKGDFGRAQKLLNACESDLRGWEWQHLNYMSVDPCIKTFRVYEGDVYSIAVSSDGRHIVTGSGLDGRNRLIGSQGETVRI